MSFKLQNNLFSRCTKMFFLSRVFAITCGEEGERAMESAGTVIYFPYRIRLCIWPHIHKL